jgi:hypothetical protein
MRAMYCPCGERIVGPDDDELVRRAEEHLRTAHPELVGKYSREDILVFAFDL